jgi:cell division protein FtsB
MKGSQFLLAFWLSTASFCLLQIVFGPGGITETHRLEEQKTRLEARLGELQAENARLAARYEALRTNPEAVRLEARALGYFESGEVPVRTLGGAEFRLPPDDPHLSRIAPIAGGSHDTSLFFRLAWLMLFLVFWGTLNLFSRLGFRLGRAAPEPETPAGNLPAVRSEERLPAPWFGVDFFRK